MKKFDYIIIGGGLPSLVLAQYIKKKEPKKSVLVIEKEPILGGQYSSKKIDKYGYFDFGMHIYYETCDEVIDSIVLKSLNVDEWHVYGENEKDPAGIFWNGRLQENIPYPDLRFLPQEKKQVYLYDLLNAPANCDVNDISLSLREYLQNRWGNSLTNDVFEPIYQKVYGVGTEELSVLASKLQALNRVTLLEENSFLRLIDSSFVRSKIATTSQFSQEILKYKANNQKAYYPKNFGFQRVIDGMKNRLQEQDVCITTSTFVQSVEQDALCNITKLHLSNSSIVECSGHIFWNAGIMSLKGLLKERVFKTKLTQMKRMNTHYVYFVLKNPPLNRKLYYIYSFVEGQKTFRVALYPNYCKSQFEKEGVAKICSEFWVSPEENLSNEDITRIATQELVSMNILRQDEDIIDCFVHKLNFGGFPIPTLNFLNENKIFVDEVKSYLGENISIGGVLADNKCFFAHEVILDLKNKYERHFAREKTGGEFV